MRPLNTVLGPLSAHSEELAVALFDGAMLDLAPPVGPLEYLGSKQDSPNVHQFVWLRGDDNLLVRMVEDRLAEARYAEIQAQTMADHDAVRAILARTFELPTIEHLLADARQFEQDPHALQRLILALNHEPSLDAEALITAALASADPEVRFCAVNAAGLSRQTSLHAAVEPLTSDSDPRVKQMATMVLRVLQPST